jgi:hypothetical protein
MLTATGPDCFLPTIGTVRLVLEPKPGLPTDPHNVRAFIDIFTDIAGLFVINNESGWYEGWMIHDLTVAPVSHTPAPTAMRPLVDSCPRTPPCLRRWEVATTSPVISLPSTAASCISLTSLTISPMYKRTLFLFN